MWRYSELLPLPQGFTPSLPVGFTPLFAAPRLAERLSGTAAGEKLYIKNDAVCLPTLSFKDRVVAVALSQARAFGFDTVSCSSTGNLANAVAAHAAREGLKAWIFIPSDLEPAKILGTNVFGAKVVRVAGNYDQVNRLCSQIADEHRWGFVNVNLRPYYAEGSKTVGFEIAEQLGWRLPDNIVCPMAGGSLITKIKKAFDELIKLGLVEPKEVKFFGAQATGCSPISTAVKTGSSEIEPQKPNTIARSLAIGNPADGHYAIKTIKGSGGWSEDISDPEVIDADDLAAIVDPLGLGDLDHPAASRDPASRSAPSRRTRAGTGRPPSLLRHVRQSDDDTFVVDRVRCVPLLTAQVSAPRRTRRHRRPLGRPGPGLSRRSPQLCPATQTVRPAHQQISGHPF